MIVLQPSSTAHEAARAMVDNGVGAALIMAQRELVGIVTDRDLASEIVAAGRDPRATRLGDIMADEVAAADISATPADVARLMQEHACRRIPVLEAGRPVGLVTLDDLLLEGEIDARTAADVVRAQLGRPARHKRAGAVHPESPAPADVLRRGGLMTRRLARAEAAYDKLLRVVERRTGLTDRTQAELALKVALGALCRRVTPDEARHFIAQLPSVLRTELAAHLSGPDRAVTRENIEIELEAVLGVPPVRAEELLIALCEAISDSVSDGQVDALRSQLPDEMKHLFPAYSRLRRAI